jgi:RNA polymerase-binding transcription factor DksA
MNAEARDYLLQKLREIVERHDKVGTSLRRQRNPLGADWQENAVVLENDEVLEALDADGRVRIRQLREALARIDNGSYGACVICHRPIAPARLQALPEIATCITCERSRGAGRHGAGRAIAASRRGRRSR